MRDFMKESDVPLNHSSLEDLRKLGDAISLLQKRQRRFRRVADLEENRSHLDSRREIQEKIRVSLYKEQLHFIDGILIYKLEEIKSATNNFSHENLITENLIKEAALGKVYKGQLLRDGNLMNITVRRLDCTFGQGDELQTEISTLKSLEHLKHKNIVSIFGRYDDDNEKIIIYQEAFHGTLDQHLNDPALTSSQRLQICLGVARALKDIHYDTIHCDINCSKIFLDEDWEPKIYGFELSTKYPQSWRHRLLYSRYFDTNNMTPKYDVYSFGVLLFEVFCGRKPTTANEPTLEDLIDLSIREQMDKESLRQLKDLTYKCLNQQQPVKCPTMHEIVKELEKVIKLQTEDANLEQLKDVDEDTIFNTWKMELLRIPLREIRLATNNFHDDHRIGSGGFATVYKAKLDVLNIQSFASMKGKCKDEMPKISKTVAIKRINLGRGESGKQGFLTELESLTSCEHPNIVSLVGFSEEPPEMILVYEYAFNGSLADYMRNSDSFSNERLEPVNLTWAQRIQICLDIAHGLDYLHTNMEGKPRIIHRDIKSDNILLDGNLNAKIADFGLCKFHDMKQLASTIDTRIIAGTLVYLDPEYNSKHKYSRKSDIYSLGVVLFEVLSGSLAYDAIYLDENDLGLAPIARRRYFEKTLKEFIDPKIIEEDDGNICTLNRGPSQDSFDTFSKIAYRCLAETQAIRPSLEIVIMELKTALKLQGETMVLSRFRLDDIKLATENFAETYGIDLGTNGMVYKAELNCFGNNSLLARKGENNGVPSKRRITVAIKRITSRGGKKEFFAELEMKTTNEHPNIVPLLGFCDEGDEMILVYDYAYERSLDYYLKTVDNMASFTWTNRLCMCLEIARGLNHLHSKKVNQQRIIHTGIKSANILLDKNSEVKIAYFGISKLYPTTNQEIGMKVYEDPEYEKTGKVKKKSDIYSFGVVICEIFSGRLAYDQDYLVENDKGIAPIAHQCFKDGTIERIMDPKLKEETDEDIFILNRGPNKDSLNTFLKVAYHCLGEAAKRPTMEIVIKELEIALNFHETLIKKLQIPRKDIESGTKNFSEKNCVGSGRFWKAYNGELLIPHDNANASGSTAIVAKRWDSKFGQGDHQFRTEVNILFKCNHENVIGLVGYCNEMDEKIILYEHMSNGSLDKYLKDVNLTWVKRLVICIDVANGLGFLHQGGVKLKKVVHRDIKSPSILLNDDWNAKISNLELSSLNSLHQDMEHANDNATFAYLDPLYEQGFLTEKSDIYSFGVVLFEILCGRLAWAEDQEDHSRFLGPLAKRFYEEGKLDEIVFEGIKEQIVPESLSKFADIAYQCLHHNSELRPKAHEVVIQLQKALDAQKDYKRWEGQLPEGYKEIIRMSKNPEIYSRAKRKDLYDILSKGILIQEGTLCVSLGSNGERNEMISAKQFSYGNHSSHKWCSVPESRFDKIAEISNICNLNIQIKIRSRSLSSGVSYGVLLVFKLCGARRSGAKPMYVNLTYQMGNETLHAYFARWRDDEWMTIELYRFLNDNESDTIDLEFLLERFSRCYCGNRAVYVEGVEFRAIDNVKPEENNLMEVQQVTTDPMQQLQTNDVPSYIGSLKPVLKLFKWRKKKKQYYMLPANKALCDSFNAKLFNLIPSAESRFGKMIELLSTQVFRIKCKIRSKMLLENTEYSCYLVFKLSEKQCGLHCPVIVRDLHQRKNRQSEVVYFRSPRPWNVHDVNRVPQEREDGWMEIYVWKCTSNQKLQNDCISMNLKFVTYEGTMSGLIICGLEFRPV
ncbi:hypothetical protein SSX86_012402 [Deinandra increscens subsp. villosa]|uniref:non-specific serine/threonine protein kinase n=1 Tax=Deinandra increscens subsp. villosa TaxID=3103831 RepID=A0AAP0D468_9ASTR